MVRGTQKSTAKGSPSSNATGSFRGWELQHYRAEGTCSSQSYSRIQYGTYTTEDIGVKAISGKIDRRRSQTQCKSMWLKRNSNKTKMRYSYESAKEVCSGIRVRICYGRKARACKHVRLAASAREISEGAGFCASSILEGLIYVAHSQTQIYVGFYGCSTRRVLSKRRPRERDGLFAPKK